MKIVLLIILVTLGFLPHSLAASERTKLPTLHKIESFVFQRPYDCDGDFAQSALFLSDFSHEINKPDLLLRGACGAERTIEASTSGDDLSVISDLGTATIESVSAAKALNYDRAVGHENEFRTSVPVKAGHTYAIFSSKHESRSLFVIHIDSTSADGEMRIRFAVQNYGVQKVVGESAGFNWDQGNK